MLKPAGFAQGMVSFCKAPQETPTMPASYGQPPHNCVCVSLPFAMSWAELCHTNAVSWASMKFLPKFLPHPCKLAALLAPAHHIMLVPKFLPQQQPVGK